MKLEEAIKTLNEFPIDARTPGFFKMTQAIGMSIAAIEKQIAKKPKYYIDMYGHTGCPGCPKNEILYAGQKFCSVCGTKIDWGKDE